MNNANNDVTKTLIRSTGKISGGEYCATLFVDIPGKGEFEKLGVSVNFDGQDYIISGTDILSHLLERAVTRNYNDNTKTIPEAHEYLASNAKGFLSPAKERQALRPAPVVAPKGRKGKASLQSEVVAWLELHPRKTSTDQEAFKAIEALPANVWAAIMADESKQPSYVVEAVEAIEAKAEKERIAQEQAAMEALASL